MFAYTRLATPRDITSFDANEIANYRYVSIFRFDETDELSEVELDWMCSALGDFMKDSCLVLRQSDLSDVKGHCFLKSICEIFENQPQHSVGIATIYPRVNDSLLLKPIYQKIEAAPDSESRYPHWEALNACLDDLHSQLHLSTLESIPLPTLPNKSKNLICPDGAKIHALRVERYPRQSLEDLDGQIGRTTLKSAEDYEPKTPRMMEDLAEFLGTSAEEITLKQLVPNQPHLKEFRELAMLSEDELSKALKLPSSILLRTVESASLVPSPVLKALYIQYRTFFTEREILSKNDPRLKFQYLLDLPATEKLRRD